MPITPLILAATPDANAKAAVAAALVALVVLAALLWVLLAVTRAMAAGLLRRVRAGESGGEPRRIEPLDPAITAVARVDLDAWVESGRRATAAVK